MLVERIASEIIKRAETLDGLEPIKCDCELIEFEAGWIKNEMWKSTGLRKIHVETSEVKGLDVLHCVFFPDFEYNIPIFGCDIVATKTVITAAIVDVSPVRGTEAIYDKIVPVSNSYRFKEKRPLPLWGDEIFSPCFKFVRIRDEDEVEEYIRILTDYLDIFCDWVKSTKKDDDWIQSMLRMDDQIHYSHQQRKNKKTIAALSSWFNKEWAMEYIYNILFDKPTIHGLLPSFQHQHEGHIGKSNHQLSQK
jgi:phycocyanobilin:ferredoxin oxidoreductase